MGENEQIHRTNYCDCRAAAEGPRSRGRLLDLASVAAGGLGNTALAQGKLRVEVRTLKKTNAVRVQCSTCSNASPDLGKTKESFVFHPRADSV